VLVVKPPFDLRALSDAELSQLAATVAVEQYDRALAAGDPAAVVSEAFRWGFTVRGVAPPRIVGAYLVCPGQLQGRPEHHDCTFVSVDGVWCWEHEFRLDDEVSRDERGQRSVTLLAATEGMECTQVVSRCRRGTHTARQQLAWRVEGGVLVPTRVTRPPQGAERR